MVLQIVLDSRWAITVVQINKEQMNNEIKEIINERPTKQINNNLIKLLAEYSMSITTPVTYLSSNRFTIIFSA